MLAHTQDDEWKAVWTSEFKALKSWQKADEQSRSIGQSDRIASVNSRRSIEQERVRRLRMREESRVQRFRSRCSQERESFIELERYYRRQHIMDEDGKIAGRNMPLPSEGLQRRLQAILPR